MRLLGISDPRCFQIVHLLEALWAFWEYLDLTFFYWADSYPT